MSDYFLRRLLLIPLTLFCILVVNFIILGLAPGEPLETQGVDPQGMAQRQENNLVQDERHLQFRHHFGLTLPVLFNTRPWKSEKALRKEIQKLSEPELLSAKAMGDLKIQVGDEAPYLMPTLYAIAQDENSNASVRKLAVYFFVRGGIRFIQLGPNLSPEVRKQNEQVSKDNLFLQKLLSLSPDKAVPLMTEWMENHDYKLSTKEKIKIFFLDTRFCKYFNKILHLDFGTIRSDSNKTVISEVIKRLKYSLTLSILPLVIAFCLSFLIGFWMALKHGTWQDDFLNFFTLLLFAIPIFVMGPFLIEEIAMRFFLPHSGFSSPEAIYNQKTSLQRLSDVLGHLLLPLTTLIYGSFAASAKLTKTSTLEVLKQDFVKLARVKGLSNFLIYKKHVARCAAIPLITSLAASLGTLLTGTLIVETLFEINGFGKFFYDAVISRDYNVILFSSLVGAFFTLIGYFLADLAYTLLDPRISLE